MILKIFCFIDIAQEVIQGLKAHWFYQPFKGLILYCGSISSQLVALLQRLAALTPSSICYVKKLLAECPAQFY